MSRNSGSGTKYIGLLSEPLDFCKAAKFDESTNYKRFVTVRDSAQSPRKRCIPRKARS